jgi:hypothetical protein
MKTIGKSAAATLVAGIVVAGAGALFAGHAVFASDGGAALGEATQALTLAAEEQPESDGTGRKLGARPFARAVHENIQVQYVDGTTKSFDYDRGQITSIGGGSIALIRRDGKTVKLSYDGQTIVREKGEPGTALDLEVGDIAMFFSHQGHADLIRCIRSPARES